MRVDVRACAGMATRVKLIDGNHADKEQLEKLVQSSRHSHGDKLVDVAKFAADLKLLDPTKTPKDIDIYLRRATQVKYGELPATMEPWPFTRNLLTLGVCKPGTLSPIEKKEVKRNISSALADINQNMNAALVDTSVGSFREKKPASGAEASTGFQLGPDGSEQSLPASGTNAVG